MPLGRVVVEVLTYSATFITPVRSVVGRALRRTLRICTHTLVLPHVLLEVRLLAAFLSAQFTAKQLHLLVHRLYVPLQLRLDAERLVAERALQNRHAAVDRPHVFVQVPALRKPLPASVTDVFPGSVMYRVDMSSQVCRPSKPRAAHIADATRLLFRGDFPVDVELVRAALDCCTSAFGARALDKLCVESRREQAQQFFLNH
mmetsp:Transcript_8540/g.25666  ORF Transcript_8540/g.25666 Transcript_8540/m.25666 type:complete len:202 (+) Transcript_8540:592-1197(+)